MTPTTMWFSDNNLEPWSAQPTLRLPQVIPDTTESENNTSHLNLTLSH